MSNIETESICKSNEYLNNTNYSTKYKQLGNIATALNIISGNQRLLNFDINIFGQIKEMIVATAPNTINNIKKSSHQNETLFDEHQNGFFKTVILTKDELRRERKKRLLSKAYLKTRLKCKSCIIGFHFEENLRDHIVRRHSNVEGVSCRTCKQVLSASKFKEHYDRHRTRYDCVECGQRFVSPNDVLIHHRRKHIKIMKPKKKLGQRS